MNRALIFVASLLLAPLVPCLASQPHEHTAMWRSATSQELAGVLPARAPVVHERIETETNSNTGITDGQSHFVAATVLITTGYAAHGKYAHFLVTQVPITLDGHLTLAPGNYLIGWDRNADGLDVHLYRAESGDEVGAVEARVSPTHLTVVSIRLWPPRDQSILQIGRFTVSYQLR